MQKIILIACLVLTLLGCGRSTNTREGAEHYEMRGVVRGISPGRATLEIQHENIPILIQSMTMPFDALTRGFSVYRQAEGGTISHGLATALVNCDRKIERIWRSNGWTPAEVAEVIQAANK
jgi:hypothetical protein